MVYRSFSDRTKPDEGILSQLRYRIALTPFHNIRTYFPHLQDLLATKLLARSSGGQVLVLIFVSSSSAVPLFVAHVCNKVEVSHLVCGIVFYYSQLQSNLKQFACLVTQRAR
jgi:hypothetical protein